MSGTRLEAPPARERLQPVENEDRRGLSISPELVLVCPELRARVLATLPDRDPDGFIPRRASAVPLAGRAFVVLDLSAQPETPAERPPLEEPADHDLKPLAVRAAAYLLQTLVGFVVVGLKLIAIVVGLTLLAEFVHVL